MQADPLAGKVPRIGTVHHGYVHVRHRAQALLMFVCGAGQRKRSRGGAGVTSPEAAATGAGSGSNAGAGAGSGSGSTPRAFPEHNDVCSTPRYEMPSFSKRVRHTPTWQVARSAVRTQLSESYTPPPGADIVGLSDHKKNLLSLLRRVLAAQVAWVLVGRAGHVLLTTRRVVMGCHAGEPFCPACWLPWLWKIHAPASCALRPPA